MPAAQMESVCPMGSINSLNDSVTEYSENSKRAECEKLKVDFVDRCWLLRRSRLELLSANLQQFPESTDSFRLQRVQHFCQTRAVRNASARAWWASCTSSE